MAVATVDNLNKLWIVLVIAGLGIGGIVIPASIISTIICPDVRSQFAIVCNNTMLSLFYHQNRTSSQPSPPLHSRSVLLAVP